MIDYGSAACLIVPTWAFRRAGGFDPVFHPAYCEDVDLLLSFRSMGLVTVFEPRSRVIHARTGSTDDVVRGSLIERNRPILLERWREELANRPALIDADGHPHRVVTLRDAVAPVRLLITTEHGSDRALESLAGRLAESRTDIRVTLMRLAREDGEGATEPGKDLLDPLEQGVEAVEPPDPAAWLEQRRLHYTAAFLDGPRVAGRLWEGLGRSQPGVFLAYTPANVPEPMHPRGATGWRAAEVAAIRAATAILYRNESERRVVPLVDPDVPTFMLDDENSLADLLPLLGIAPPERAAAPA